MKARVCSFVLSLFALSAVSAGAQEVVLHSTDVTTIKGNWTRVSDSSAASSQEMSSSEQGWSSTAQPQGSPADYFEASFTAQAWVKYRVWIRARATNDSKWNESVWLQFSDSLNGSGSTAYRIGSTSGILMNLEECSGCGVSNWGWTGGAYWVTDNNQVQFSTAGTKTVRVQTREDGVQIDQIVLSASKYLGSAPGAPKNDSTRLARSGGASAPAPTSSKPVPGTIEAEDFENGSNGSAYYDRTSGNYGNQYRSTDVDIERTADSSGSYNVGWIDSGEWLDYPVNVTSSGTYTIELRVASMSGSRVHVEFDGVNETGTLSIPGTGGWQSWTTVRKDVSLSAGEQVMRVEFESSGANFNYVKVVAKTSDGGGSGPYGGTARAVPGTIQAEDFDLGANGTGYYDNSSGNNGGKYRSTDVDIESTGDSGGGYNLGWVGAGEWLNYTVNVATAGTYTLTARVASSGNGGTFYVEFNGSNKTGTMTVPNTGGWQSYRDVNATVSLSSGVQTMRVRFASNGSTGAIGNVNYIRLSSGSTTPPPPTSGKIRVMTWNIHFGKTASNVLNLEAQARVMSDSGADVILLQEGSTWDGDQPNRFPELLQQYTGRTWYMYWVASATNGIGQGVMFLSKYPFVSSSKLLYEGTGFGQVAVDLGGVRINILNTHLEYYDTSKRTRQLNKLMEWARNYSGPRIVGGDFNSWWGESWIKTMETEYSDTWQDVTGSDENGYTHNNVRFDYLFRAFTNNYRLTPTACWVISTSTSDHRPVVADYTVK
jgi:endonuclease/exonuclease/phosphatase family metal-dependent hydrolase